MGAHQFHAHFSGHYGEGSWDRPPPPLITGSPPPPPPPTHTHLSEGLDPPLHLLQFLFLSLKAENCVERCHYTHVYRDKKCVTASSTQSIGTGNPTSIPLTTVIPRTGSPSTVKPTTGKLVPQTSRRPAKGKPTTMESTAGKSSTMNITIGNPTSSNPTTGEQVTTGPATSKTKAKQQGL